MLIFIRHASTSYLRIQVDVAKVNTQSPYVTDDIQIKFILTDDTFSECWYTSGLPCFTKQQTGVV